MSSAMPRILSGSHRVHSHPRIGRKGSHSDSLSCLHAAHCPEMDDAYTIPTAAHAMHATDKPESIDLSHHLSELAKARISSPLKVRRCSLSL